MENRLEEHRKSLEIAIGLGQRMQGDLEIAVARAERAEEQLAVQLKANEELRGQAGDVKGMIDYWAMEAGKNARERDDLRARLEGLCEAVEHSGALMFSALRDELLAALAAARGEGKAEPSEAERAAVQGDADAKAGRWASEEEVYPPPLTREEAERRVRAS